MKPPVVLLSACLALAVPTAAQTVTVTTCEDVVDIPPGSGAAQLPGPDGLVSFREALLVTNATPGPQTVAFAIPAEDWWLFSDHAALKLEQGVFFVTDDETTLDFSTQTALTGDTNPNGGEVGVYGLQVNGWGHPAIGITGSHCVVKGLGPVAQRSTSIWIAGGSHNRVIGCTTLGVELDPYPGSTSFNTIGGTAPGEGNVLDHVDILCGSNDNEVVGNQVRSVSVVGSPYCEAEDRYPLRNRIGGPTAAERNVLSGAGSYSSEGFPTGHNVQVLWARDTLVQGNYIGTTPDGLSRVPQVGPFGVTIADSFDTIVRDNLIAGQWVQGIQHYDGDLFGVAVQVGAINADTLGVTIQGNLIGTDASGTAGLLTLNGVRVAPSTGLRSIDGVLIGGEPSQGNLIAFTEQTGVSIEGNGDMVRATVSGNRIHENGQLGLDLGSVFGGSDGVTANDPLDADDGANGLQNFPSLTSVTRTGGDLRVAGQLESLPGESFQVEIFASAACDDSGHGEGQQPLGRFDLATDGVGQATFDVLLSGDVPDGWVLAATATRLLDGGTSEFSACASTVWRDEGHALVGLQGQPRLTGQGDLSGPSVNSIHLASAAPGSTAGLFVALHGNPTPFKGGQLVPLPLLIPPLLAGTDVEGRIELAFVLPAGVPAGTELWMQWAIQDDSAAQGVALSNTLVGRTP